MISSVISCVKITICYLGRVKYSYITEQYVYICLFTSEKTLSFLVINFLSVAMIQLPTKAENWVQGVLKEHF